MERLEKIKEKFIELYGKDPEKYAVGPGRVDLLGIHTDYNDGFVLPIAVDMDVLVCGSKREDKIINIYSFNTDSQVSFDIDKNEYDSEQKWSNYSRGVVKYLLEYGAVFGGADIVLESNLPIGSGLSSSAALESATGLILQSLYGFDCPGEDMAQIGKKSENLMVGVSTGIMDQFASCNCKKDFALFLDCRSLEYKQLPLDCSKYKVVVCDTKKRRGLVDSEYDTRRKQCFDTVDVLKAIYPDRKITHLRDISLEMLEENKAKLTEMQYKRAKHVISENNRGLAAIEALGKGDFAGFGQLMNESHDSARDYYEVSCPELEAMVEACRQAPGAMSGRLAGAGFGGCCVALVDAEKIDEFKASAKAYYDKKTGLDSEYWVCSASDGAHEIK
ncbi:MAG: galactokinase [Armatimonadetes bacterium]|nr:galactokinase [Candidatus Hippobium faecium]